MNARVSAYRCVPRATECAAGRRVQQRAEALAARAQVRRKARAVDAARARDRRRERFDDLVGCLATKRHDKRRRVFQVRAGPHLCDCNRNVAQRWVP